MKEAPPYLRQLYVALGPILITTSLGMTEGYSAILLPQLEEQIGLDDEELSSWIASMAALPMALGCILGGYLMEKIGRKTVHVITCIPCIIGWLFIYFSSSTNSSIALILTGRFLTGFCVGLLGPPTGVYISETSAPKLRGFLLASISFAIALGLFLSHIIGTFFSWENTALFSCSFPVAALIAMAFTPESPTWLAKAGRSVDATEAFYWCRGRTGSATSELLTILERQKNLNLQRPNFTSYMKSEFLKPLVIIVVFFVTIQWSGLNAVTFYSVAIIEQTMGNSFDQYLVMLIIDVVRVIMSVLACILLKKLGRRPLAIISGSGTALSLLSISLFSFMGNRLNIKFVQDNLTIIPLIAFVAFVTFITIGFVPLPWTMMGEVFPLSGRGMGSAISALTTYAAFFSVVKTTPLLFDQLKPDGAFLVYGTVATFATAFLAAFLPETKDKPLHEIEDGFKKNVTDRENTTTQNNV